jgi:hypothetical protein
MFGGIVSTAIMTLTEIPSWKKWGLHGVFEWHENQVIAKRMCKTSDDNNNNKIHFKGIFLFHFLKGTLAGIFFPFIAASFFTFFMNSGTSLALLGMLYGFVLWIITLVPIHKPITGFSPWNHPLGRMPALASLSGHIMLVLGHHLLLVGQVISLEPVTGFIMQKY